MLFEIEYFDDFSNRHLYYTKDKNELNYYIQTYAATYNIINPSFFIAA